MPEAIGGHAQGGDEHAQHHDARHQHTLQLASRVLELARASVLANNHFLARAVGRLVPQPLELQRPLATDGSFLAYDAKRLLAGFRHTGMPPAHDLLHTVVHCLFLHPYVGPAVDRAAWDLACDLAAERVVAELEGPRPGADGALRLQVVQRVERDLGHRADAERIYAQLKGGRWKEHASGWAALFASDSHELWHASMHTPGAGEGQGNDEGQAQANQQHTSQRGHAAGAQQQDEWRNVATSLLVDLQTTSARQGSGLGGLVSDLEAARTQRADYAAFLRRFARPGEVMCVNDDEFDQVFYTYGLALYGDLPLVEPLEYRDEHRIREFVIVIDTSESVQGAAIRLFLSATFDVLATAKAFFQDVHVRILQCDLQVTSDVKITQANQLGSWQRTMCVAGGGGTDFRPAFAYIDQLVADGAFADLGGVLYFTDGLGTYPEWVPAYPVAFVFYDGQGNSGEVPPWAYQVRLDDEALAQAADRSRREAL